MEALTIEQFNALLADAQESKDNQVIEALRALKTIEDPQNVAKAVGDEAGWMLWT